MDARPSCKLPRCLDSSKVSKTKYTPHVLPCRIKHNGVVKASSRYWKPQTDADGSLIAYFRGRKLRGRKVDVPEGYRGLVLKLTNEVKVQTQPSLQQVEGDADVGEDEEEADGPQPSLVMEEVAGFDNIAVWGHDLVPQDVEDPYIRGVEEWIKFASAMHSFDSSNP